MQNAPPPHATARACLAAALAAALGLAGSCSPDAGPPRGVLLISVDSLRADHLSCYGYESPTRPEQPTSPIVDRVLAERGTLFEHAVSTTSWTLPSHMALLTGLPDELHGVQNLPDRLDPSRTLLAEVFRDAGWRTAGFWSGPNLHPYFGFERGFERYVDCSTSHTDDGDVFQIQGLSPDELSAKRDQLKELHDGSHEGYTGPALVAAFEEWFDGLGDDERFFAFVHMWDVHYDYTPPPAFDVFDRGYAGPVDGVDVHDLHRRVQPTDPDGLALTDRDVLHLLALYDGEIFFTDFNVGEILARLSRAGRLDDTLVVFTSDHGDEFLEHGKFGHNNTLYEEVVHVPLILRLPGALPAGKRLEDLVSIVDVAPTILDLCDLRPPPLLWGQSLLPALSGDLPARVAPLELTTVAGGRGPGAPDVVRTQMRGVHAGGHKVIRDVDRNLFLFDLEADPTEHAFRRPAELEPGDGRVADARRFWAQLDSMAEELSAAAGGEMPEELLESLRAHGYVGDDAP